MKSLLNIKQKVVKNMFLRVALRVDYELFEVRKCTEVLNIINGVSNESDTNPYSHTFATLEKWVQIKTNDLLKWRLGTLLRMSTKDYKRNTKLIC